MNKPMVVDIVNLLFSLISILDCWDETKSGLVCCSFHE